MPHPETTAPITDRLLEALIALFKLSPDEPLDEAEARLMFAATPLALEELRTYRALLGQDYLASATAEPEGPNVVRFPPRIHLVSASDFDGGTAA